jgi:hypothetical protein
LNLGLITNISGLYWSTKFTRIYHTYPQSRLFVIHLQHE